METAPDLRDNICTAGNRLLATSALPDAYSVSFDCVLSAKCADVSGVLGDFHLLDLLAQRGTVSIAECQNMCAGSVERNEERLLRFEGFTSSIGTVAYLVPYLPVTPTSVDTLLVAAHLWIRHENAGLTLGALRHYGGV